jgi:hypothetical protein
MTTPAAESIGTFHVQNLDTDLAPYLFLQEHHRRAHTYLAHRALAVEVTADALPGAVRVLHSVDLGSRTALVGECGDAVVLLSTWRAGGGVWVSAASDTVARTLAEHVCSRAVRPETEGTITVRFTSGDFSTRTMALGVKPWTDIAPLYPASVRAAVDALVEHRPVVSEARRLLLWYGAPGTGKTTAVRALLHAWRGWADGVVVTDAERLLGNGSYLRRVVLDAPDDGRWRLVVLEDVDGLLRRGGPAADLGRLLNLADGLLGQGLRCLFLLTTNEPIGELHPALVRPGRCLAQVEFGALSAAETAALLGRPVERGQTLAEVMTARPTVVEAARPAVGQYL